MPYVWHTAWPPGAADGCLFGLSHREQVEDATSTYGRIGLGAQLSVRFPQPFVGAYAG